MKKFTHAHSFQNVSLGDLKETFWNKFNNGWAIKSMYLVKLSLIIFAANFLSFEVLAQTPCGDAYAGIGGSASFCEGGGGSFNLEGLLSDNPDPNGTWNDNDGAGVNLLTPDNVDFSSVNDGTYTFTYEVQPDDITCSADAEDVTINIENLSNPGSDNSDDVCNEVLTFTNLEALLGAHDGGGNWNDDDGSTVDLSDPTSVNFAGVQAGDYDFTYSFAATNLCPEVSATITISVYQYPDSTIDGDDFVCPESIESYMTQDVPDATYSWSLSGGGSIVGPSNLREVEVEWGDTPGGPHQLSVAITTPGCYQVVYYNVVIEGIISLACNDGLQVSLDDQCKAVILPDIMLEGPLYEEDSYEVIVKELDGSIVPNATVNSNHIGETLIVQVNHLCSGGSCWGTITIEDKWDPALTCEDITISCADDISPQALGSPSYVENCGSVSLRSFDEHVKFGCDGKYSEKINRTWIATDESDNSDTCVQMIWLIRTGLEDIQFPESYDNLQKPAFTCGGNLPPLLPNGFPDPAFTGKPTGIHCFNVNYYYNDIRFDACGAGYKILRQWTVLDWCTGEEKSAGQVIKMIDDEAPDISCPPDNMKIGTDPGICTGSIDVLPDPIIIYECSEWSYTVAYKLRDEDGNPYENPITDNVIDNGDGTYGIYGLPQDTTWIVYTVTDACGFETQCFTEIVVLDDEPPSAVCESHTVVTLGESGWADVYAETFNDHSFDNCMVDYVEVKRVEDVCGMPDDLEFSDRVNFCCEDVGGDPVQVVMRVYDKQGFYNDCWVSVNVQDKFRPTIAHCPPDITVNCDFDYSDPADTGGEAWADDNCSAEVTFRDFPSIGACGLGSVRRVWTATDPGGLTATCTQYIYVEDVDPFDGDYDIDWPGDLTLVGCSESDAPVSITGEPIINNDECISLAISHDDEIFGDIDGFCLKILRTWTVVDWCNYDVTDPDPDALWTWTQKISLTNSSAPSFTSSCSNRVIDALSPDCSAYVELIASADDDCTPSNEIEFYWEIDFGNNGGVDDSGIGNNASNTYPSGTHKITFYATDACENTSQCMFTFRIRDDKAPTPICLGGVSFPIPDHGGSVTIWASDLNSKSTDNCTGENGLIFSFSANTNDQSLEFDCDDLPNGVYVEKEVQIWVTDEDGNKDYCTTTILVTDNKNICPDAADASAIVAGTVVHPSSTGVEDVMVRLSNGEETASSMDMTDEEGNYYFQDVNLYEDYDVAPSKQDIAINGVSTLDLVLIQKHILGITEFESPYTRIAADVNNSYSISASDLVELRKVILGVKDEFSNNESWRFVDAGFEFVDETKPWPFTEVVSVEDLLLNEMDVNFVAVKVGDVNWDARLESNYNEDFVEIRTNNDLEFAYEVQSSKNEDLVHLNFNSTSFDEILGFQYTLGFDASDYEFLGVKPGVLNITEQNMGLQQLDAGRISVSWHSAEAVSTTDLENLFSLIFKQKSNSENIILDLNSEITRAEAYTSDLEIIGVVIERSAQATTVMNEHVLHQNKPNPFADQTSIGFELPNSSWVILNVMDINGKIVKHYEGDFEAGYHEWVIRKSELPSVGILYYQLQAGSFAASKKMIIIE